MSTFTRRPLVYIAAPYSSNPVVNTHDAITIAERLHGTELVTAYVPHLNLAWDLVRPHPADYWYSYDLAFLVRCDGVLRVPGDSPGADNEVVYALRNHIPVFYDEESLLEWASSKVE